MTKFREFWQLVREFGSTMFWAGVVVMVCMFLMSRFLGLQGMLWVLFPVLGVIVLLVRGEELVVRPAKKAWVAVVALTVFAILCWISATMFSTAVTQSLGMAASVMLSLLVAFRYAGSPRKGKYHAAAICLCCVYLVIGGFSSWAFTSRQQMDAANRGKNFFQSLLQFAGAKSDVAVADVSRETRMAHMDSMLPVKVVMHNPGSPEDFKDDTGMVITAYRIQKGDVVRFFPEDPDSPKTFGLGEPFGKIRVDTSAGHVAGWFRYEVLKENLAKEAELAGAAKAAAVPPTLPPVAPVPVVRSSLPTTPTIPPRPAAPVVVGRLRQTVTATKGQWTVTQVAVGLNEHVWLGSFPSENDARRLVVCIDGGTPVFPEPYLWPSGQYGTRIHRMSGDQSTQFLWVQVSDGADLEVNINKQSPY